MISQTIFALAHTDIGAMPFNNHGRTLRLVVQCNVRASGLWVLFSNRCGQQPLSVGAASVALCDKDGVLRPDTLTPLTADGLLTFELAAGQQRSSDLISFDVEPGDYFALNLYYPTDRRVVSGNWLGQGALRSRPGNFSADLTLPGPGIVSRFARTVVTTDMTVSITSVAQINAVCKTPAQVVGCFGDSITQQSNWTTPLAKLLYHKYPGQISLCNLGISGNRLLADSPPSLGGLNGIAGVRRFAEDMLGLHGLTHAILAIGTNDIGLPGAHGLPESELITPRQYADAMTALAEQLHNRGVQVYAATLTPRALNRPYDEFREELRLQMNRWLRTASCFDAVLDFDAALARGDGRTGMADGCALPDGLHPSPLGGMLMAKAIDLSLFAPTTQKED